MFSVKDTLACLEMGAVETLIVWENLDMDRYEITNSQTGAADVSNMVAIAAGMYQSLLQRGWLFIVASITSVMTADIKCTTLCICR